MIKANECVTENKPIRKGHQRSMSRDGRRALFVRSVANVLRPDRGAGKRRPAPTIGGVNSFRGHKKPSSRASGDDSKRIYLHKNEAAKETWRPLSAKNEKCL